MLLLVFLSCFVIGLALNDVTGSPVRCSSDESLCHDGTKCIRNAWRCDGEVDCNDGSDELNCLVHCNQGTILCNDGLLCVRETWRCDGETDCPDGSDEINCSNSNNATVTTQDDDPIGIGPTAVTTQENTEDFGPTAVTIQENPEGTTDTTVYIKTVSEDFLISTRLSSANRSSERYALTDGRYYAFHFVLNWFQAAEFCYQLGKRSATFNSEADYNQLTAFIRQKNGYDQLGSYWTAGSDLSQRGKWAWHPRGRPLNYTRWGIDEPSDLDPDSEAGVERCIELKGSKSYTMNDCPCDIVNYVICENIE